MRERLDWVDGLRAVAVLLVVLDHTWQRVLPGSTAGVGAVVVNGGLQGVSLFLVLSGFCLSHAYWRGKELAPSSFFASRVLRILPPYYVALGLVALLDFAVPPSTAIWSSGTADVTDVAQHVLLVHNLTPDVLGLNGPFWSLGLEWQWYLVFPAVFIAATRRPWQTLLSLLLLSVVWTPFITLHSIWYGATWLPGRLLEFAVGIVLARMVSRGEPASHLLYVAGGATGLALVAMTAAGWSSALNVLQVIGLYWPLWAVTVAALFLAGWSRRTLNRVLSARPLRRLGRISYSVYLVHCPIIGMMSGLATILRLPAIPAFVMLVISGIGAGAVFYTCVERPVMSGQARAAILPRLERWMRWTDRLYRVPGHDVESVRVPSPSVVR